MSSRRGGRRSTGFDAGDLILLGVIALAVLSWLSTNVVDKVIDTSTAAGTPASPTGAPSAGEVPTAKAKLASLTVQPRRDVPGYQRSCSPGKACSFGPAWSDDTSAPDSHNGCGTRDDVLAAQLKNVKKKSRCVVRSGVLAPDPYTGKTIQFTKQDASKVQIDHVYPLSLAWDMGAAVWPQQVRDRFANDTRLNLLAADGPANAAKGDSGPGEWMPANRGFHCTYATKFITVASFYKLAITAGDRGGPDPGSWTR